LFLLITTNTATNAATNAATDTATNTANTTANINTAHRYHRYHGYCLPPPFLLMSIADRCAAAPAEQMIWIKCQKMMMSIRPHRRPTRSANPCRAWAFNLAYAEEPTAVRLCFEYTVYGCIIANTVLLASEHMGEPAWLSDLVRTATGVFMGVFLAEAAVKLIAVGTHYFNDPWNWCARWWPHSHLQFTQYTNAGTQTQIHESSKVPLFFHTYTPAHHHTYTPKHTYTHLHTPTHTYTPLGWTSQSARCPSSRSAAASGPTAPLHRRRTAP
jgi:hypothetical protein